MAATAYFNKFPSYCRMVAHAKSLANRSVLVDHCGIEHIDLTSELANVERVYAIEKENRRGLSKLSLIEFKTSQDAERIAKWSHHNPGLLPVPLKVLRYNCRTSTPPPSKNLPYPLEHVTMSLDRELSPSFSSYTELMSNNLMSLVALKLRFITLVNLERILCSGMFESYELMPFGSSVIDMGCDSGDLDLIFIKQSDHYSAIHDQHYQQKRDQLAEQMAQGSSLASKLVHLDKSLYSETKDNSGFRGTMRWFDNVLREYMPLTDGFGVLTLHRAKVPIIKFTSRITNIDCDLSFDLGLDPRELDNGPVNHGILMTEILYSLCRNSNLITALVIYLRIFAKLNSITSKVPGVGMTNFQFLSIVIFFLQQTSVVPTSHQQTEETAEGRQQESSPLVNYPTSYITKDQRFMVGPSQTLKQRALVPAFRELVDSNFLQELSHQNCHYADEELNQIMPLLVRRFFDYYSGFDFNAIALNLYEARRDRKLDNSVIFVLNPIDRTRNICHNVNRKGLDTLVKQSRAASQVIRRSNCCPLTLVRSMLLKHHKQVKKNRSLGLHVDEEDDIQPFSPEGIAEDVCR